MSGSTNDQQWNDPANWRAGVIYVARRDSRVLVPKRTRFGLTINFGHPLAWLPVLVIVALILLHLR